MPVLDPLGPRYKVFNPVQELGAQAASYNYEDYLPQFNMADEIAKYDFSSYIPSFNTQGSRPVQGEDDSPAKKNQPKHWILDYMQKLSSDNEELATKNAELKRKIEKSDVQKKKMMSQFGQVEQLAVDLQAKAEEKVEKYKSQTDELEENKVKMEEMLYAAAAEMGSILQEKMELEEVLEGRGQGTGGIEEEEYKRMQEENRRLREDVVKTTKLLEERKRENSELQKKIAELQDKPGAEQDSEATLEKLKIQKGKNKKLQEEIVNLKAQYSDSSSLPPPNFVRQEDVQKMKDEYEMLLKREEARVQDMFDKLMDRHGNEIYFENPEYYNAGLPEELKISGGIDWDTGASAYPDVDFVSDELKKMKREHGKESVTSAGSLRMLPSCSRLGRHFVQYPGPTRSAFLQAFPMQYTWLQRESNAPFK